jgi:hypothetical protein
MMVDRDIRRVRQSKTRRFCPPPSLSAAVLRTHDPVRRERTLFDIMPASAPLAVRRSPLLCVRAFHRARRGLAFSFSARSIRTRQCQARHRLFG